MRPNRQKIGARLTPPELPPPLHDSTRDQFDLHWTDGSIRETHLFKCTPFGYLGAHGYRK
jgi:hypothetical protein